MKDLKFLIFLQASMLGGQKVIVKVPVLDLVKKPFGLKFSQDEIEEKYANLSFGDECCQREYQLLFNEKVSIEQELGKEVKVKVPSILFFDPEAEKYSNEYWALKENFISLESLELDGVDLSKFPNQVYWNRTDLSFCSKDSLSLTMPFEHSGLIYSAGTRFHISKSFVDGYKVYFFNFYAKQFEEVFVPKEMGMPFDAGKTLDERISDFVNLIRRWTKLNEGFIPYVYAGSSFTTIYKVDEYKKTEDGSCAFYWRQEFSEYPYTGFDCSCIISRVAQMCGMAYFYKDSLTLSKNLKPLEKDEPIEPGDIIWFPGHVMIVSDVKNNLLLESRGYAAGFGKTHEISLSKAFAEIENYDQLIDAHLNKHSLKLLARDGSLRSVLEEFKIFKFKSFTQFNLKN